MPLTLAVYETETGKLVKEKTTRSKGYPGCIWANRGNVYAVINFQQFFCAELKTTLTALASTNAAVFKFSPELVLKEVYVYASEAPYILNSVGVYPEADMMYGIAGKSLESLAYYHPNDPNYPNGLTFALIIDASGQVMQTTLKYPINMKNTLWYKIDFKSVLLF